MLRLVVILLLASSAAAGQSIDEFQRQAAQLVRDYQWQEASSLLRRALTQHPDNPALLEQLANLLVRSGDAVEAKTLLQKALALDGANIDTVKNLALAELRLGQLPAAVRLLWQVVGRQPSGESYYQLAFALFIQGEMEQSLACIRRAVELSSSNPHYRLFYATLLSHQGRNDESYEQLAAAEQLAPRNAELLLRLAEQHQSNGQLAQAREYLQMAAELDPENPLYHARLAHLYQQLGQKTLAAGESRRAAELLGAFDEYIRAVKLSARRRRSEAAQVLEPVVTRFPEFTTGLLFLAYLHRETGQDEKALDCYWKILERDPMQIVALEGSAWIQARSGSIQAAIELLRKARPQSPNQILFEGYRQLLNKNWDAALHEFKKTEVNMPLNADLLELISFCVKAQGRTAEAIKYLEKAQQARPSADRYTRLILDVQRENAFRLLEAKNWKGALDAFASLIRDEGLEPAYFFNMAYCRQQLGDLGQAVADYRTGLEADPEASWARVNLAYCLSRLSRHQEAARQWETIASKSATFENYYQLGLCYMHLERFAEAERAFEKSLQMGKQTPELLYHLGVSLQHQKRSDEAWRLIRRSALAGYGPARNLLSQAAR